MTSALQTVEDNQFPTSNANQPIDPQADAEDALQTLRQFVLDGLPEHSPPVANWLGLDSYIEELCAYGIQRLTREPDDLISSSIRLRNELEEVACGNYRALIESFECAGAVRGGVSHVRARLDHLVIALPKLAQSTRLFSTNVAEKQRERESRLRSLSEHRAIADILEMPRLMSTLIAAALYDEALELRECAVKLHAMHTNEPLIFDVCQQMDMLTQQMVLQLLVILRNPVQLPMCLRVVGFLRRLHIFSDYRLRVLFLYSRGEWMRNAIETATAATQQAQLVNLSDNMRAMVFEIITQYRAVFNDVLIPHSHQNQHQNHLSSILYDWTSSCVLDYLQNLRRGVQLVKDGAALNTILQQAMYCGQSLGRVGADFRAALPPIFENAVLCIYNSHLNAALRQFEMMIEANRWAPVGSSAFRKDRGHLDAKHDSTNHSKAPKMRDEHVAVEHIYDPPLQILDSPPLAVFVNGIIAAFNELRLCAPVSLGDQLGDDLRDILMKAAEYMSSVGGPGGAFLKKPDRPHFISMASCLRNVAVQYTSSCLDYCMNINSLVNVKLVQEALADLFGQTVVGHMQENMKDIACPQESGELKEANSNYIDEEVEDQSENTRNGPNNEDVLGEHGYVEKQSNDNESSKSDTEDNLIL